MYIYIYLFAGGEAGRSAADEIQGDAAVTGPTSSSPTTKNKKQKSKKNKKQIKKKTEEMLR